MNSKGLWEGFKVDLLKGDNNWPVVMQAVRQINHAGGWLTAEVNGGDRNHLKTDLGTNGCNYLLSVTMNRISLYLSHYFLAQTI